MRDNLVTKCYIHYAHRSAAETASGFVTAINVALISEVAAAFSRRQTSVTVGHDSDLQNIRWVRWILSVNLLTNGVLRAILYAPCWLSSAAVIWSAHFIIKSCSPRSPEAYTTTYISSAKTTSGLAAGMIKCTHFRVQLRRQRFIDVVVDIQQFSHLQNIHRESWKIVPLIHCHITQSSWYRVSPLNLHLSAFVSLRTENWESAKKRKKLTLHAYLNLSFPIIKL